MKPVYCAYCQQLTGYRDLEGGTASFGGLCDPPCPESQQMHQAVNVPWPTGKSKVDLWDEWNRGAA